jgi:hypothetical protein
VLEQVANRGEPEPAELLRERRPDPRQRLDAEVEPLGTW